MVLPCSIFCSRSWKSSERSIGIIAILPAEKSRYWWGSKWLIQAQTVTSQIFWRPFPIRQCAAALLWRGLELKKSLRFRKCSPSPGCNVILYGAWHFGQTVISSNRNLPSLWREDTCVSYNKTVRYFLYTLEDYNIWEDSLLAIHSYLQFSMDSHKPNMLTTSDTQRAKGSSLSREHRVQRSTAGLAGQDAKSSLFLCPPSSGAEQSPSNLSNTSGSYSLTEVRVQLGAVRQGMRVQVARTHPLCWFATGTPTVRNLQELWVTLLPPRCAYPCAK